MHRPRIRRLTLVHQTRWWQRVQLSLNPFVLSQELVYWQLKPKPLYGADFVMCQLTSNGSNPFSATI